MALRSFVEQLDDPAPLTPILPQLMESIFRLMNEVRARQRALPRQWVVAVCVCVCVYAWRE